MTLQDRWLRLPLSSIIVRRTERQRRNIRDAAGAFINSDGLLESIRARGVMNAIIIDDTFVLLAGERRLEASRELGLPDIPVRFAADIPPTEREMIELEENLKRTDLPWKDECLAVVRLHELYCTVNAKWSQMATESALGYTQLTEAIRVSRDISSSRIAGATSIRSAYNILARVDDRATADAVNDIVDAAGDLFGDISNAAATGTMDSGAESGHGAAQATSTGTGTSAGTSKQNTPSTAEQSILCLDAIKFLRSYAGPSFNFIHCDFPYGVNVFGGTQGNTQGGQIRYKDDPNVYWRLIDALCEALPRIMSHSAHLMFWLSADIAIQWKTLEVFRTRAPQLNFFRRKPLIWHKTDNVGILADSSREPRHVYETAIFASVEDRRIIRAVSDTYGAPTDKSCHPSCKPEPVLRHFFSMFVDENSTLFDPTCGSGTALRAAESLGARTTLGLESDAEHCKVAQSALRSFRTLRKVAR